MISPIQLSPAFIGKNQYRRPFCKLDVKRQIQVILDVCGLENLERDKRNSSATKKARAFITHQFFDTLRQNQYHIKNVLNLSQKHIHAVVQIWLAEGISPATLQSRFSVLRWFTLAIGKACMVKNHDYYGVTDEQFDRTYVSKVDKSWTEQGVISQDLISRVSQKDAWVGMRLEAMDAFGLRLREATLLKPAASDGETVLRVEEGSKGGRTRVIPIRTDEQRQVLNRAKEMARLTDKRNLIPTGSTLQQALSRTYYICRIFGITKNELEITPHGLRHAYANDRYEEISGMTSAVRGSQDEYDRDADQKARETVSKELGHTRTAVTAAYTGARVKGRPKKPR